MGKLRTANKRHNRALAAAVAARSAKPVPVAPAKVKKPAIQP